MHHSQSLPIASHTLGVNETVFSLRVANIVAPIYTALVSFYEAPSMYITPGMTVLRGAIAPAVVNVSVFAGE